jgi:hypothetical protein
LGAREKTQKKGRGKKTRREKKAGLRLMESLEWKGTVGVERFKELIKEEIGPEPTTVNTGEHVTSSKGGLLFQQ